MATGKPRRPRRDLTSPDVDSTDLKRDWDADEAPFSHRVRVDVPEGDALEQSRAAPLDDEEHE